MALKVMLAASAFVMRRHLTALGALRNHQGTEGNQTEPSQRAPRPSLDSQADILEASSKSKLCSLDRIDFRFFRNSIYPPLKEIRIAKATKGS